MSLNEMSPNGLVGKLLVAGVVELRTNELRFTDHFCSYLVSFNDNHIHAKVGSIEGWHDVICSFDSSLDSLSEEEIAITIVLLDYFLEKVSSV